MEKLKEIYYDPNDPGSYGGVEKLYRRAKEVGERNITRKDVKQFLTDQHSYSLHKPARRNFTRNPTYVKGIDQQWQPDLADMQGLKKENDHYGYIMTVIDVFSKKGWAIH